ncbi:MAG: adenosylmethionine decarboxylase [Candidatus Bilamarchaeaceae archaeon]
MGGLHIISEFFSCENNDGLKNKEELRRVCKKIVDECGLNVVGSFFHKFGDEGGVTGVIVLAESHVSIHTWPEREGFVNMDVFVCNVTQDNSEKAREVHRRIKDYFKPKKEETQEIMRK